MYLKNSIDNTGTKFFLGMSLCIRQLRPPPCARYTGMFERGRANGDGELIRLSVQRHGV